MTVATENVKLTQHADGKILEVSVDGKLDAEDYDLFVPTFEHLLRQHGKLRVLIDLEDLEGWTAGAMWQDVKFDFKHWSDIDRLAIVGDSKSDELLAKVSQPFTKAEVRFFERSDIDQARAWLS